MTSTAPIDRLYDYPGYHGRPARCRLRIFALGPDRPLVALVTELRDNPGTSVTNRAEVLAGLVTREYSIDPDVMCWIEHYPTGHFPETFKRVEFQSGSRPGELERPAWSLMTRAAVERLIGGPLAD
jgi:hypothetical protein